MEQSKKNNKVINIMLIYHAHQMDLLILISDSKLTLLQHVIQFHMTLFKNISQTPDFRNHVICYTLMEIADPLNLLDKSHYYVRNIRNIIQLYSK